MARIVVALGGNALGDTPAEQIDKVTEAAESLVKLVLDGNELVLCHGNGPQVGMIDKTFTRASGMDWDIPLMPLAECTAMSQGYIGYHLQQAMAKQLSLHGTRKQCVTIVTEVLVDPDDPGFQNPTKPIGEFVDQDRARVIMGEYPGTVFKEDAARGWREYVASPAPVSIIERDAIVELVGAGFIVVACGGGGIPVVRDGDGTRGVVAVIDKDRSAAKLAEVVGAESLIILTAVDNVAINWGTPQQSNLEEVDAQTMRGYLDEGHFAEGSMKPKVEAALSFVEGGEGREAIIGSLERASQALAGTSGTRIK